jgi:hypothetical protein
MPHGFKHAITLLLTNRVRSLPADASPDAITAALTQLADELVALARDMHEPPAGTEWLAEAFDSTLDRIPLRFDLDSVKAYGRTSIGRLREAPPPVERRDVFLIYVPADRLPMAAPLAIELSKRRVTVAFSEYEVASPDQLARALERGLSQHRGGLLLHSTAFDRAGLTLPEESPRLKLVRDATASTSSALAAWARSLAR